MLIEDEVTIKDYIKSLKPIIIKNRILIISIIIILLIVLILDLYKIFEKQGKKGWISLIPFYREYTLCEISNMPGITSILLFIPIINIIYSLIIYIELIKALNKNKIYILLLIFFPIITLTILAFTKE